MEKSVKTRQFAVDNETAEMLDSMQRSFAPLKPSKRSLLRLAVEKLHSEMKAKDARA